MTNLFREDTASNAAEYCILLACIALAIFGVVTVFGNTVYNVLFNVAANSFP